MATSEFDLLTELGQISRRAAATPLAIEGPQVARQLEDVVALLNFQLSRIDNVCERWSGAIAENAALFSWDDSKKLSELYKGWLGVAETIAPHLHAWVVRLGELPGAPEFQANLRRIQLMSLDTERSKRSIDSLEQGKGTPIDHAAEELQSTLPTQMLPPVTSSAAPSHATGSGFHTRIVMGVTVAGTGVIGGVFYSLVWALDTARLW